MIIKTLVIARPVLWTGRSNLSLKLIHPRLLRPALRAGLAMTILLPCHGTCDDAPSRALLYHMV